MPHSIEAEQSVIGAMIMDRDAIATASGILKGSDFYSRQYGILFDSMVELNDAGQPVDIVTLQNKLKEKDVPPEVSSLDYMRDILRMETTSANIRHYAKIVADHSLTRQLIRTSEEIASECYSGKEKIDSILDETERKVFGIISRQDTGDFVPIRDVVQSTMERIEKACRIKGNVTGVPTGFMELDYRTAGMQPSDLILVAARPSMGKTALVLNMAQYMAFECKESIAIFSLEMGREQLMNRLLAMESHVDANRIRTGQLTDSELIALVESAGKIMQSNLIIDATPGISVSELRSKCRKYKLEYDIKAVMIDYLQLMTGSGKASESRQQEVSEISRSLKALARELNVPVIALSQLSRACESRPDKRPMLSDLRESGAIEQDADVVMFIYRDDYYHHDSEKKGIAEINIAKQRNGPIGVVELLWMPEYTKFVNLERERRSDNR
ncbi:MAG: replicative DNA helicase [Lachnospiraceae bacterium]|nr:replicative DNA helicase [Lachnospiraceae bacterium]